MKHKRQHADDKRQSELTEQSAMQEAGEGNTSSSEEVVPGVSIVRSNTPRPLSFEAMVASSSFFAKMPPENLASAPAFPAKAPSAPPLPEEIIERNPMSPRRVHSPRPSPERAQSIMDAQEFIWLFEYGLEMDTTVLNSFERLAGVALSYGPARLQGYKIVLGAQRIHGSTGPTIVSIIATQEVDTCVWGILYRVPYRVIVAQKGEPSLLDTIHAAIAPQNFFQRTVVVAHETYRQRDIQCLTYVATDIAQVQLNLVTVDQWQGDNALLQRLYSIAKKQKFPESYLSQYKVHASRAVRTAIPLRSPSMPDLNIAHSGFGHISDASLNPVVRQEQNTEPLPTIKDEIVPIADQMPKNSPLQPQPPSQHWLISFSLYLVLLLLISLIFAVLQGLGFWSSVFSNQFSPLGVPWLVMMYGLLGGCISSIVTLGRLKALCPPVFVIITWFTRPFIGAVLAVMSYLLLTSGFFAFNDSVREHMAFFLLAGMLAGLSEGRIFFKHR